MHNIKYCLDKHLYTEHKIHEKKLFLKRNFCKHLYESLLNIPLMYNTNKSVEEKMRQKQAHTNCGKNEIYTP